MKYLKYTPYLYLIVAVAGYDAVSKWNVYLMRLPLKSCFWSFVSTFFFRRNFANKLHDKKQIPNAWKIIMVCLILSAFFLEWNIAFHSSNKIYPEKKQDRFISKILTNLLRSLQIYCSDAIR
jgi:hypothetical protein